MSAFHLDSYAVAGMMNNSRRQGTGWPLTLALFVIYTPTHFLSWCEEMLFRYCRPYRHHLLRKRLRSQFAGPCCLGPCFT